MSRRFLSFILSMLTLAVSAKGQPASPPTVFEPVSTMTTGPTTAPAGAKLKLATQRLVVFKDGHGLVIQSGTGTADEEGRAYIADVPDSAVLGCFWAVSDKDTILGMRAE